MLRMSRMALGSALALSLMTGAVLAQSQTQEKLPWATAAEPAKTGTTQVAAVDKKQAVPPLPTRNAMFAAQEAEAKAGPLQRLLQGSGTQDEGSDVSRAFRQGDSQ